MLTDLISLMLMLCLNIYLDDSLSDKVDLNMNQNCQDYHLTTAYLAAAAFAY